MCIEDCGGERILERQHQTPEHIVTLPLATEILELVDGLNCSGSVKPDCESVEEDDDAPPWSYWNPDHDAVYEALASLDINWVYLHADGSLRRDDDITVGEEDECVTCNLKIVAIDNGPSVSRLEVCEVPRYSPSSASSGVDVTSM